MDSRRQLIWLSAGLLFLAGCSIQQWTSVFPTSSNWLAGTSADSLDTDREFVYWHGSFPQAATAAEQSNRPILIAFTGSDWCSWCKKLDREVFDTPKFARWANRQVTLLKADFPKRTPINEEQLQLNEQLKERFEDHFSGYPTIVFTDSTGMVLGSLGYVEGGPEAWIEKAEQILTAF